jgi:uncharacterized protein (TIGR02058 family)
MSGEQRLIIETGMGTDLHGGDVTKAALRAVDDAMRRSSLPIFGSIGMDHADMRVQVTLGAREPERIDTDRVAAHMPRGAVTVRAVEGGMQLEDGIVVVTAAVEAFLPLQTGQWRLSDAEKGDNTRA